MAEYQTLTTSMVLRRRDGASVPTVTVDGALHAADPSGGDGAELEEWLAAGGVPDPADPLPVHYVATQQVDAGIVTTDDVATEIYRFAVPQKRVYQGNLVIFGVDRGNFVSKAMEGRFTWKRTTAATAVMVGITVVSDIRDSAASVWMPNAIAQGSDIVFTVKGAAGRTIDWRLTGVIVGYAPDGSTGAVT